MNLQDVVVIVQMCHEYSSEIIAAGLGSAFLITLLLGRFVSCLRYFGGCLLFLLASATSQTVTAYFLGIAKGCAEKNNPEFGQVVLGAYVIILSLFTITAFLSIYSLPGYVAKVRGVPRLRLINTMSWLSVVIWLLWPVAIGLAHGLKPVKGSPAGTAGQERQLSYGAEE